MADLAEALADKLVETAEQLGRITLEREQCSRKLGEAQRQIAKQETTIAEMVLRIKTLEGDNQTLKAERDHYLKMVTGPGGKEKADAQS